MALTSHPALRAGSRLSLSDQPGRGSRAHRLKPWDGPKAGPLRPARPCGGIGGPTIQTQLEIGKPNDKYEQEAERMAEEALRTPPATATMRD